MTVTAKCIREAKFAEATDTTQYTAPTGTRTIVDKFTVANGSGSAATLTVNVVASGGSVALSNRLSVVTVPAGASVSVASIAGQVLNPGDSISTLASTAAALVIRISGREVT